MAFIFQEASEVNLPLYLPEQWLTMSKARKCKIHEVIGSKVVGPLFESPTACYCLSDENNRLISTLFIQTGREMPALPMLSILAEYNITDAILMAYNPVVLENYSGTAITYCCGNAFINPKTKLTSTELASKLPVLSASTSAFRLKCSAWENAPKPGTMKIDELQNYSLSSMKPEEFSAVLLVQSIVERLGTKLPTQQVIYAIKTLNEDIVYFGSQRRIFRIGDTVMDVTICKNVSSIIGDSRFALYATKERSIYQFMLATKSTLYIGTLEGANKKWPLAVKTTHQGSEALMLGKLYSDIVESGCSRFMDYHSALDISPLWRQHRNLQEYFS